MNTAADAIDECVERFVQEILAMVEHAREERRAEALKVVAGLLTEAGRPAEPRKASAPGPAGAREGGSPAKEIGSPKAPGAVSSERTPGRQRRAASGAGEAAPTSGAKPAAQSRSEAAALTKETTSAPPAATAPNAPASVA
jgi:hypothetical protein